MGLSTASAGKFNQSLQSGIDLDTGDDYVNIEDDDFIQAPIGKLRK